MLALAAACFCLALPPGPAYAGTQEAAEEGLQEEPSADAEEGPGDGRIDQDADTGEAPEEVSEDGVEDTQASVITVRTDKALSGWSVINRKKVYVDPETGKAVTDAWKEIDGKTYRFDDDGACITGYYEASQF